MVKGYLVEKNAKKQPKQIMTFLHEILIDRSKVYLINIYFVVSTVPSKNDIRLVITESICPQYHHKLQRL